MATYNLAQENNRQNKIIFETICAVYDRQNSVADFLETVIKTHTRKIVELHNTECNKLDRMIALLEKIAGE